MGERRVERDFELQKSQNAFVFLEETWNKWLNIYLKTQDLVKCWETFQLGGQK